MRPRLAWRTASPARSMSAKMARASPATVAFLHALGNGAHRLEVAVRGDGEARLDDVDAHGVEAVGDLELLLERHGRAGALLAVAQRGVEDPHPIGVGLSGLWSFSELVLIGLVFRSGQPSAGAGVDPSARSTSYPLSARPGSPETVEAQGLIRRRVRAWKRARRGSAAEGLRAGCKRAVNGDRLAHGQVLSTSRRFAPEPQAAKSAQDRLRPPACGLSAHAGSAASGRHACRRRRAPRCRRSARCRACPRRR